MSGNAKLKALNAVLAAAMLVLMCVHGVGNAFQLMGAGSIVPSALAWALLVIACVHAALGIAMTATTLSEQKRVGKAYWKLNKRFWVVRASGLAIALLVICHVLAFGQFGDGPFRLNYFGGLQLAVSLLLVLCLCIHVLANLQPLMISLGVPQPKGRACDLIVVFAIVCALCAAAFVVYFVRWSVI